MGGFLVVDFLVLGFFGGLVCLFVSFGKGCSVLNTNVYHTVNFRFFSSNLRRVLQDAFLGKKWQGVPYENTYMILYVFLLEVCEE